MLNLDPAAIIFFGFLLDLLFGDPPYRGHPVRLIGRGITFLVTVIRKLGFNGKGGGAVLVLVITVSSLAIYVAVHFVLNYLFAPMALVFDLFVCYSCLAMKDLADHIRPVANSLKTGDLEAAKRSIAMVVGRDVRSLDEAGIRRAAIETLAENFVDGFLSPVFWYVVGGITAFFIGFSPGVTALCFMIAFKVASTLDSMVGYKNEEFSEIGWAGARLDDLMNFIPARLSLIVLFVGAWIAGLDPKGGMRMALKDRLKHDSPNAAHAESFVAGALHIRLGGPTQYSSGLKSKPWLGKSGPDPGQEHIGRTVTLLNYSAWISIVLSITALILAVNHP